MSPVSIQPTLPTTIPCKRKHIEEDAASTPVPAAPATPLDGHDLLSSMSLPDLLLLLTSTASIPSFPPLPQEPSSAAGAGSAPDALAGDDAALSCFDQDTAPPSSILPPMLGDGAGDDWFLLDHALSAPAHEQPESPSCSSASSFSTSPSITPAQPSLDAFAAPGSSTASPEQSNEYTVMIMTGRVAQKSYGTEKRFLCPPPTTVVLGPSLPLHTIRIQADGGPQQSGTLEPTSEGYLQCISRHLHITEKRKQISVAVDLPHLGKFSSNPIKVISKPSKKRQSSMKHLELCVHHGSTIALFNRIRSQTVSTKYLGVNPASSTSTSLDFVARQSAWDPFLIWAVDGSGGGGGGGVSGSGNNVKGKPNHPNGALHYNQRVVLQCVKTGMMTPVMVIRRRKNEKDQQQQQQQHDDPVSQLHRIALEVADQPSHYLACINDQVITNAHMEATDDQAIWTIIGTDCTTYRFRTSPTASSIVTPFPQVDKVVEHKDEGTVTLHGQHLGAHLSVALADCIVLQQVGTPTDTQIKCTLPSAAALATSPSALLEQSLAVAGEENTPGARKWPVALVRQADGTIYRTSHFCTL